MDKKEDTRRWIDDLIYKLQIKKFTGSVKIEFYEGGITVTEINERFKNLHQISALN